MTIPDHIEIPAHEVREGDMLTPIHRVKEVRLDVNTVTIIFETRIAPGIDHYHNPQTMTKRPNDPVAVLVTSLKTNSMPSGRNIPIDPIVVLRLLEEMSAAVQGLRIQQSQLLAESTWDKALYGAKADADWATYNHADELITLLLQFAWHAGQDERTS